jgi:pyrroline-5-carboxylate reductase
LDLCKISFVGPGVMAEAMIAGLIRQNMSVPGDLIAAGPGLERLSELRIKYGIETTTDNPEATRISDIVVLSIKPQRLARVLAGLKGAIPEHGGVIYHRCSNQQAVRWLRHDLSSVHVQHTGR